MILNSMRNNTPKYLQEINKGVAIKLKQVKRISSKVLETRQIFHDQVLEIYQQAFNELIENTITYSTTLDSIKRAYDSAIQIRDERISQFITQDKVFGVSAARLRRDDEAKALVRENEDLREKNLKLTFEITKLKKEMGKMKDEQFSEYLSLARERDARYTLYFENLALQLRLRELGGGEPPADAYADPVVLRLALDRCREKLSSTQRELHKMAEEYAETVPRREFDRLENEWGELGKRADQLQDQLTAIQDKHKRLLASKKSVEEELIECKERCRELECAGTPRPQWELCADFISGGRDRWWQLASGLSSRDMLRVLLKELGPAAESEHLEYFDGLGTDPSLPPYLRYEGRVRNLRLSRRALCVLVADVWRGKWRDGQGLSMQDYVTKYFEDRYQQPSVRAEWAYNLCAGSEQMLDEPQIKLFWGVLHGHLSEDIYWGLRAQWQALRDQLYRHSKDGETISVEEFEKVAKATLPLKSDVDVRGLSEAARRQLKLRLAGAALSLDQLFHESEEGFDRSELARELHRQRRRAQERYVRELRTALGRRPPRAVAVDALRRAFAVVDPAIDHIRMERNIRWAFSDSVPDLNNISPLPLRTIIARLAAGDIERVGPRYRGSHRRTTYK